MRCRTMLMLAAAAGLCAQQPRKTAVDSLVPIPAEAELVCQSARDGEPSPFQQPATEIYVDGREGDHLTRITHQRKLYNHIAVSPDRQRIAAGRFDRGDTNGDGFINAKDKKTLVVLDLEHRQEWTLADDAEDTCLGGVDWTPDGQYIIASMRVAGEIDIYRIRPDTGAREALTKNLGKLLGGIPKPVFVSDVSVSFDGNWIVFLCVAKGTAVCRLARMRIDGSEAHFITDGGGASAKNARSTWGSGDFDPEFSPDGQYVSFQRSTSAGVGPRPGLRKARCLDTVGQNHGFAQVVFFLVEHRQQRRSAFLASMSHPWPTAQVRDVARRGA